MGYVARKRKISSLTSTVAVQPREEVVHPEEGKERKDESDYREPGDDRSAKLLYEAGVEERRVGEPGNKGPGLFRVPAPEPPPCI